MLNTNALHLRIWVSGTVQGVWFRKSTVEAAQRLHISGTVENLPDGRVLIEAEGIRADLDALIAWCWKGPPKAEVNSVRTEAGLIKGFTGFAIRH